MITGDQVWIGTIDHRISTAVVYFMLLLILGNARPRQHFPLRALCSLLVMCLTSWCVRTYSDVFLLESPLRGLGYSFQLLALFVLFLLAYRQCYRATTAEVFYNASTH